VFDSIDDMERKLAGQRYFADRELATAAFLSYRLKKPLLLEGAAGIGKSEVAAALARAAETPLFSLQCYPGIDASAAFYEWNYSKQLVRIHLSRSGEEVHPDVEREVFSEAYLVKRPVLAALSHRGPKPAVLLVERIDRAGDEFQLALLDVLNEWRLEVPQFGTFEADVPPLVFLTSGSAKPVNESLQRRCIYHWMDYPDFDREVGIVSATVVGAAAGLVRQACNIVAILRREPFARPPGVSETVDWVRALTLLRKEVVDQQVMDQTVGCLFKDPHDIEHFRTLHLSGLLRFGLDREI
jgi:MoxR-like ATPase